MQNYKIIAGGVPQFSILIFAFCILHFKHVAAHYYQLCPSPIPRASVNASDQSPARHRGLR